MTGLAYAMGVGGVRDRDMLEIRVKTGHKNTA
jgi:hypothetical protein